MSESPQEFGKRFEEEFAQAVNGSVTPASGATFHTKLDVKDKMIRWSAKATTKKSFSLSQDHLDELARTITASGGIGSDVIAAMAIRIGDSHHDVVVLPKDDFIRLMTEGVSYIRESKGEARRTRSRQPILFRDDDTNENSQEAP